MRSKWACCQSACECDGEKFSQWKKRKRWRGQKSWGGTLTKQDFVVVDCTGIALSEVLPGKKMVYWSLVAFMNITIRSFNSVRYLSLSS